MNVPLELMGDPSEIDYPDRRQFPCDKTVDKWKSIGHLYVNYTGLLLEEYRGVPEWCLDVKGYLVNKYNLQDACSSIYCMPPGTIMPEHRDTYPRYKTLHNLDKLEKICRILVFLNDWESGHYFEVDKKPVVNWTKGEYIMWRGDTPHIAANVGSTNRYTMQITAHD